MARLTNLDQMIFVPINDEIKGTSYEMKMTLSEFFVKFFEGFEPDIIEAVPMEWLKSHEKDEGKLGKACRRVRKAWEKEET